MSISVCPGIPVPDDHLESTSGRERERDMIENGY